MANKDIIQEIIDERNEQISELELKKFGYTISGKRDILGNPASLETNKKIDEIKISPSQDETNPLNKEVTFNPVGEQGVDVRPINIESMVEELTMRLKDGTYLNLDDFIKVLEAELEKDGPNTVYVAWRTQEILNKTQLIEAIKKQVLSTGSYLKAKSGYDLKFKPYEKLTEIRVDEKLKDGQLTLQETKIKLGKFHTQDEKIDLGNGKYILAFELEKALTEYIRMEGPRSIGYPIGVTPKPVSPIGEPIKVEREPQVKPVSPIGAPTKVKEEPPIIPIQPIEEPVNPITSEKEQEKEEIHTVILRRGKINKALLAKIVASIMTLLMLLSLLKIKNKETSIKKDNNIADFNISSMEEQDINDQYKEALDRIGAVIGADIAVEDGVPFHESSDYDMGGKNNYGIFGKGLRDAGKYNIHSFSIVLPDGTLIPTYKEGVSLKDHLDAVLNQYGYDYSDVKIRVSLTDPVAGWVDFEDLGSLDNNAWNLKNPQPTLAEKEKIAGFNSKFDGKTISFENESGVVTLNVLDENGNLLTPGATVISSDGNTYRINNLKTYQETEYETKTTDKKQISFDLSNLTAEKLLAAMAAGALAAALGYLVRKNDKETAELTEEEINVLVESAKRRYDSESEFSKAVETITKYKIDQELVTELDPASQTLKDALIEQAVTIEQIGDMRGR